MSAIGDRARRPRPVGLPEVMTVKEVAVLLHLGQSTVYEMAQRGELEAFQIKTAKSTTRGAIRVTVRSVQRLLERSRITPLEV
jgi:transposase